MKANAGKRKIFDAVDLLTEDTSAQVAEIKNGIEQIKIDDIQAFHDHPFHLYEGERLQDMVQTVAAAREDPAQRLDQRQRQVLQARQQMMQMTNLRLPLSILTLMVKTATGITR